jgi:hypothetical protein
LIHIILIFIKQAAGEHHTGRHDSPKRAHCKIRYQTAMQAQALLGYVIFVLIFIFGLAAIVKYVFFKP